MRRENKRGIPILRKTPDWSSGIFKIALSGSVYRTCALRPILNLRMFPIIGIVVVLGCIAGGYLMEKGNLLVLACSLRSC